ncbi:MAG: hypothetical protein IPJ37_08045 [Bacteroidales bacterium]|nr:hypothetical protein [Bacteroidales bacterium]
MKTKLIISLLAFLAITTLASGQNKGVNSRAQSGRGQGTAFVDANNNGICDNYENRVSNASPGRRSGNFDTCGQGQRQRQGQGQGKAQRGCRQGQGRGKNFVDADKNGVCDNKVIPSEK